MIQEVDLQPKDRLPVHIIPKLSNIISHMNNTNLYGENICDRALNTIFTSNFTFYILCCLFSLICILAYMYISYPIHNAELSIYTKIYLVCLSSYLLIMYAAIWYVNGYKVDSKSKSDILVGTIIHTISAIITVKLIIVNGVNSIIRKEAEEIQEIKMEHCKTENEIKEQVYENEEDRKAEAHRNEEARKAEIHKIRMERYTLEEQVHIREEEAHKMKMKAYKREIELIEEKTVRYKTNDYTERESVYQQSNTCLRN